MMTKKKEAMKLYTGTKTIKAIPMTLGAYNKFRGWELPEDEKPGKKGYLVGYSDAKGNFDGKLKDGCHHISWSPKDVFDAAYFDFKDGPKDAPCAAVKTEKTLHNSDISGAKINVPDIKTFGNGDLFKLISKASSATEGWMKSTKAMEIPGVGCVVQITTQQGDNIAEAVTFVPDVRILGNAEKGRTLSKI